MHRDVVLTDVSENKKEKGDKPLPRYIKWNMVTSDGR